MRKSKDTLTIGTIFFHVNVPLNYPKRASTSLEVAGNQISFLCSHLVWSRGHLPVLHPLAFTRVCTDLSKWSKSSQCPPPPPLEL